MKCMKVKQTMWSGAAMVLLAMTLQPKTGLAQAPADPTAQSPATSAPQPSGQVNFPKVDVKNFTALSPTVDEVNNFIKSMWGYDENRVWQVAAILKTPAPGIAKVVVFVADKTQPEKGTSTVFFTTPDGKHAIADKVMVFGAKPFADTRALLQTKADGPLRTAQKGTT